MKKILIILSAILIFSGCKKIEDLNQNIKDPANVTGESLFTGAQKRLVDQMVNANVNRNIFRLVSQYWCETTYTDESNYDLTTRSIPDNHWDEIYISALKNLDESKKVITNTTYGGDADPAIKTNKLAVVEIMSVYAWSVLVETFGDVPYSKALDVTNELPAYDDGLTIYKDLIARLTTAIGTMDVAWGSFDASTDNIYQGDVTNWKKFANSLKLKMGMILSDIPSQAAFAKATVEAAVTSGVFTSNADNGSLSYLSSMPSTNPIYEDLVASGRHDFVPTSVIVDTMNVLNDPRRPFYFTLEGGVYVGGENGASNDFTAYSHVSDLIQGATFEGTILDYAEVEFYLAEAVERGYAVSGTAESHYNSAITASITYWGGTVNDATTYLAQTAVAYTTATGTYKQKIGTQKWIALYNRGFEAWTEWRRLDFPALSAPVDAYTSFPVRFTYPIAEQTLNAASYDAASAAIGGDLVTTKLFWDKY